MKSWMFILATLLCFPTFAKVAPTKAPKLKEALRSLSREPSLESLIKAVESRLSSEDAQFLREVASKSGRDLSKPFRVRYFKNKLVIENLGVLQLRLNGKEVTFRNVVVKLDSRLTYKDNVLNIAKKFDKAKTKKSAFLWLPEAHADDITLVNANEIAMTMKYLSGVMNPEAKQNRVVPARQGTDDGKSIDR